MVKTILCPARRRLAAISTISGSPTTLPPAVGLHPLGGRTVLKARRAPSTAAVSTRPTATSSPGPSWIRTAPSGPTNRLPPPNRHGPTWPQPLIPATKHWFSTALARTRVAKASIRSWGHRAGTAMSSIPCQVSQRASSGNRRSKQVMVPAATVPESAVSSTRTASRPGRKNPSSPMGGKRWILR